MVDSPRVSVTLVNREQADNAQFHDFLVWDLNTRSHMQNIYAKIYAKKYMLKYTQTYIQNMLWGQSNFRGACFLQPFYWFLGSHLHAIFPIVFTLIKFGVKKTVYTKSVVWG